MSGRNTASRLGRHEPSPSRLDVQESFRHHPLWPLISAPDLPDRIDPLIGAVRAAGDRVVWVLHAEPGTGGPFDPASGHVRPMDGLAPAGGEPVLTKTSHNAFTTTNLHQYLTAHGVRELVISGIRTEQCCETTARIGADLGYRVTFVTDATATNPIPPARLPARPHPRPGAGRPAHAAGGRRHRRDGVRAVRTLRRDPHHRRPHPMTRVTFLLVPGLHLLDLAGPAQVFSGLDYELGYVAEEPDVPTAQGITVRASTAWPEPRAGDVVVVPGWRAPTLASSGPLSPSTLRRLRDHHEAGATLVSVCAGADALGRAGLLDGRRCTTHHDVQDELARRHPRATVVRDVLYVVDGRIVTSAGIASGIDLALHLAALWHGPAVAARIARDMVVYTRRNGTEPQASAVLRHRSHLSDLVHRVQDVIDALRRTAPPGRPRPRRRMQPPYPDPLLRRRDRSHPAALPADPAPGTRRAPHRPGRHRRIGRPRGRLHRRPDAPPPPWNSSGRTSV
nr:hypothetical protein GCM10010200_043240 [Actinomadura rugatobispora]